MIELAVICGLLVALCAWQTVDRGMERREAAQERDRLLTAAQGHEQMLLQRIQAPQAAVTQHHYGQEELLAPPAVRTDDEPGADEGYWLSKEDLAEDLMTPVVADD